MKKVFFFAGVFLLLGVLTAGVAFAKGVRDNKSVVLSANEVINGDYFAAGDTIVLSGTVNGNAYLAGGSIIVDGTVNGDVFAAGGTVTIRGTVRNDLRVAGGYLTLSGPVNGGVILAGGNVQLNDSARIGGSLVAGAGNMQVFSTIGRGMTVGVGQLTVGSQIGGNILAGLGQFTLSKGAVVNGDIRYASQDEAIVASDAIVIGKMFRKAMPVKSELDVRKFKGTFTGVMALFGLAQFLGMLLLGYIFFRFAPKFMRRTSDTALARPWHSLLIGFLVAVVVPVAAVMLLITIIGAPIAVIAFAVMVILWPVSNIMAGYFIGNKVLALMKRKERTVGALALGLVILCLVRAVPVIGWVVGCALMLIGLGALLLQKKDYVDKMRAQDML